MWPLPRRALPSIGGSALAVLSALPMVACGPSVRWRARSPDLQHVLEAIDERGSAVARLDATRAGAFLEIAEGSALFTERAAHYVVRDAEGWRVAGPEGLGPAFLEIALPLRRLGAGVLYVAADAAGWHVVDGTRPGPPLDAPPADVIPDAEGRPVYVARTRASERVVVGEALGVPFDDVELLGLADGGARVVYAGRLAGLEHVVVGERVGPAVEDVLELAAAREAEAYAAILGHGEACELVHAPPVDARAEAAAGGGGAERDGGARSATRLLGAAPLLSHLRLSDDGAHVACLAPSPGGESIEVWLDGAVVARHRRVEGERLAFVPGTARLAWLSEDAQGIVVHDGETASERFEAVEGPVLSRGRMGFVGRRAGRSEVWIDGARAGEEPYATALQLGPGRGGHFAYVARTAAGRFVVTRRGRWPIPRFFVDTLALDASGEHWAALVPDAAERRLGVWVDGQEVAEVPAEEVLGPAVAAGTDPAAALRAVVVAVLARAVAAR